MTVLCAPAPAWDLDSHHSAPLGGQPASASGRAGAAEPQPEAVLLEADAVVAGYVDEVDVLRGADLTLHPGERVGVIGPNGAGKSTLLKALFGLLPVRRGAVRFRGQDVTRLSAHELVSRGISYVPQLDNVFPTLTVEENLEMGLYQRPRAFNQRREAVVAMFPPLAERMKQRAGSLSGGERRMLAVGRGLMMDPQVLLLDEPSAGLAPMLQDEVFDHCMRVSRAGVAIVMVEQNAYRCLRMCHRGYVMNQGRNVICDTGRRLLHEPAARQAVLDAFLGRHQEPPPLQSEEQDRREEALVNEARSEPQLGEDPHVLAVRQPTYEEDGRR